MLGDSGDYSCEARNSAATVSSTVNIKVRGKIKCHVLLLLSIIPYVTLMERRGGLMVSVLDSRSSGSG